MNPVYNFFLFGNQGVVPKYTGFTDVFFFLSYISSHSNRKLLNSH